MDVVNTQYRNSYSLLSRIPNVRVNSTIILPFVLEESKLQFFLNKILRKINRSQVCATA